MSDRYARPIGAPLDDTQLVEAAQAGDRAALDQLLRRHYERIHAVCRRVAGSSRDADDACQEALIKIVRSLPRFDGRSTFGTWAYRVATNAALDELRRRGRRPALRAVGDDDGSEEPTDAAAERRVTAVEDRLALDEALGELTEEYRVAVVLRDVADLDYDEIAQVLDVPVGTVKSRIARGRRTLADRLRVDELPPVPVTDDTPVDRRPKVLPGAGNRGPGARRPTHTDASEDHVPTSDAPGPAPGRSAGAPAPSDRGPSDPPSDDARPDPPSDEPTTRANDQTP